MKAPSGRPAGECPIRLSQNGSAQAERGLDSRQAENESAQPGGWAAGRRTALTPAGKWKRAGRGKRSVVPVRNAETSIFFGFIFAVSIFRLIFVRS